MPDAPDLRTAAQALLDAIEGIGECPFCKRRTRRYGTVEHYNDAEGQPCPADRVVAALAAEATEPPPTRDDVHEAAAELIAAEDEMGQRDREYDELEDRDCDFATRQACLDRAIEGRHAYTDARRHLVALLSRPAAGSAPNPQGADEPSEVEQLRRLVKLHAGAHQFCGEAFIHMGEGVMRTIADGGTLADVLDLVGDCMNERDAVDEACETLFDRAKAVAGAPDEPGDDDLTDIVAEFTAAIADPADPTPEQIAGCDNGVSQDGCGGCIVCRGPGIPVFSRDDIRRLLAEVERLRAAAEQRDALAAEAHQTEQVLAAALPDEFPTLPDSDDQCTGEHVLPTLAAHVVNALRAAAPASEDDERPSIEEQKRIVESWGWEHRGDWHDARCDRDGSDSRCWHSAAYECSQPDAGRMLPLYLPPYDLEDQ